MIVPPVQQALMRDGELAGMISLQNVGELLMIHSALAEDGAPSASEKLIETNTQDA